MTPSTYLTYETQIHEGVAGCFLIVLGITVNFHSHTIPDVVIV